MASVPTDDGSNAGVDDEAISSATFPTSTTLPNPTATEATVLTMAAAATGAASGSSISTTPQHLPPTTPPYPATPELTSPDARRGGLRATPSPQKGGPSPYASTGLSDLLAPVSELQASLQRLRDGQKGLNTKVENTRHKAPTTTTISEDEALPRFFESVDETMASLEDDIPAPGTRHPLPSLDEADYARLVAGIMEEVHRRMDDVLIPSLEASISAQIEAILSSMAIKLVEAVTHLEGSLEPIRAKSKEIEEALQVMSAVIDAQRVAFLEITNSLELKHKNFEGRVIALENKVQDLSRRMATMTPQAPRDAPGRLQTATYDVGTSLPSQHSASGASLSASMPSGSLKNMLEQFHIFKASAAQQQVPPQPQEPQTFFRPVESSTTRSANPEHQQAPAVASGSRLAPSFETSDRAPSTVPFASLKDTDLLTETQYQHLIKYYEYYNYSLPANIKSTVRSTPWARLKNSLEAAKRQVGK